MLTASPVLTGISNDTGRSATDGITTATTFAVLGSADPGSTVTLTEASLGAIGSMVVSGSGRFSINVPGPLAGGNYQFRATETQAGVQSALSATLSITVDLTQPAAPGPLDIYSDPQETTSVWLDISASSSGANSLVTLYQVGYGAVATSIAGSDGTGYFSIPNVVAYNGVVEFYATSTDVAGNTSGSSRTYGFDSDVTPNSVSVTSLSATSAQVSWSATIVSTGYSIERSPDGISWQQIAQVASTAVTYTDTTVPSGAQPFYRIRALTSAGYLPYSDADSSVGLYNQQIIDVEDFGNQATSTGSWSKSVSLTGYYGPDYWLDGNSNKGATSVLFTPTLINSGQYQVYAIWTASSNRATNTPFDVMTSSGVQTVTENQTQNNGTWVSLGTFTLSPSTASVRISNTGTNGYVVADAIKFVAILPPPVAATGLTATRISPHQINLTWNDVSNETYYSIERQPVTGGSWVVVGTAAQNVTSWPALVEMYQ